MNQFKNGTLFVVVATFITVILLLLTGRNEVKQPDEPIAQEKPATPEKELTVAAEKEKTEAKDGIEEKPEKIEKVTVSTIASLSSEAPKGPFKSKTDKSIEVDKGAVTNESIESVQDLSQPIWMTQTLGEFTSLKDNDMVINVIPTNPSGLQGDNPSKVVTSKSGRFVPNSMPADYNYQEMPMYNGGYYVAPMPSYLMSSVLPKSSASK